MNNLYLIFSFFSHCQPALTLLSHMISTDGTPWHSSNDPLGAHNAAADATKDDSSLPIDEWLLMRVGALPRNSIGWFRSGVGFYNKKEFQRSVECFQKSVELDPLNVTRNTLCLTVVQCVSNHGKSVYCTQQYDHEMKYER